MQRLRFGGALSEFEQSDQEIGNLWRFKAAQKSVQYKTPRDSRGAFWWKRRGSNPRPKTDPMGVYKLSLRFDVAPERSQRQDFSSTNLIYFAPQYEVFWTLAVFN
jgi:hypothetical protein